MEIVDLSHPIYTGMPVFKMIPTVFFAPYHTHEKRHPALDFQVAEGVSFSSAMLTMNDHAGTHVDATIHYDPEGKPASDIPLDLMYGKGLVLDVSHRPPKASITIEHVEEAVRKAGELLAPRLIVLFYTGAPKVYGTPAYDDYVIELRRDMLAWLVDHGIKVMGIDMCNYEDSPRRPSHMLVREKEFYMFNNLTNLDRLLGRPFTFIGFPLKLVEGTASPVRAVAVVG